MKRIDFCTWVYFLVLGIKFQPGVLHEVFDLLQTKAPSLNAQERCCLLMIDEMSIQPKLEYDPSTSSVRGHATLPVPGKELKAVATHGLVFMLCGISTRWKQVVAYHYTGDFCSLQTLVTIQLLSDSVFHYMQVTRSAVSTQEMLPFLSLRRATALA